MNCSKNQNFHSPSARYAHRYPATIAVIIGPGVTIMIVLLSLVLKAGQLFCLMIVNIYRIVGNFGKVFNLAIWRIFMKSPKLI